MSEKQVTECVVCMTEVEVLEEFNGEMMCDKCYNDPENYVFGDDKNE